MVLQEILAVGGRDLRGALVEIPPLRHRRHDEVPANKRALDQFTTDFEFNQTRYLRALSVGFRVQFQGFKAESLGL